ncbi:hypothetical protein HYS31_03555 [Candidatus Woesearchaeota archaeon]|nr:hypothetical protein [Candidatus Woesearchaeota archaeon]
MVQSYRMDEFVRTLDYYGLTDILLPFMLIFVIIFAVLQKTKILGDAKKNLNVVVALVVGLLVVVPHATGRLPPNADPVLIMNEALPQVSIVLVAIIFLLILIGVFGQESVFLGVSMPGWITFLSLGIILIIFGGAAGWWSGYFGSTLENFFGTDAIAIAIMLLVFGIVIAWITSESKEREERSMLNRMGMDFSKLFGGKGGGH